MISTCMGSIYSKLLKLVLNVDSVFVQKINQIETHIQFIYCA